MSHNTCDCPHHKVLPIIVLLISILFLLGYSGHLSPDVVHIGWPILLGIGALTKLGENTCKCC